MILETYLLNFNILKTNIKSNDFYANFWFLTSKIYFSWINYVKYLQN